MANWYVSSVDGSSGGTSRTWWNGSQTTYDNIARALALIADNDNIYVDSAHNFLAGAAISWDVPTTGQHVSIVSVNRTTGAWLAGALEDTNLNAVGFTIGGAARAEEAYVYGVTIKCGAGGSSGSNTVSVGNSASTQTWEFDTCTFTNTGTATGAIFGFGSATAAAAGGRISVKNSTFNLPNSAASKAVSFRHADIEIRACTFAYAGATKPNSLFGFINNGNEVEIIDCNLSGYEKSGGAYVDVSSVGGIIIFRRCKLSSTPALITGTWEGNEEKITWIDCEDSANTKYIFRFDHRLGTLTLSSSIYANDGSGATYNGTNYSWKIVTTSSCGEFEPFVTPWLMFFNSSTSSLSPWIEMDNDGTTFTDRTAWAEFEYSSNASFLLGSISTTRNSNPFTGSGNNLTSSSIAWAGTGGFVTETKEKISATFTPSQAGMLRARLFVGAASKTLYLDPAIRR